MTTSTMATRAFQSRRTDSAAGLSATWSVT